MNIFNQAMKKTNAYIKTKDRHKSALARLVLISFLFSLTPGLIALAGIVGIQQTVNIIIPTTGITLKLYADDTSFDSMTVSGSSATFDVPIGSSLSIVSEDGYNLTNDSNMTVSCFGNFSRISISSNEPADRTVTVTPIANAVCPASASSSSSSSGGGGAPIVSGSSGGSGGGGSTSTPASSGAPKTTPLTSIFKDVAKVSAVQQTFAQKVVLAMINKGNYKIPKNKKLNQKAATQASFAVQLALTAGNRACDKNCKAAALKYGVIDKSYKPSSRIKRIDFYEMIVKSRSLTPIKGTLKDVKKICKDVRKISDEDASVFLTAHRWKFSNVQNKRCNLVKGFNRLEALQISSSAF